MATITLNTTAYPIAESKRGAGLMQELSINFKRVQNGHPEEMKRYAYCVVAGAAIDNGMDWNYTIDGFIKDCPADWRKQVEAFLTSNQQPATSDQQPVTSDKNKTGKNENND